MKKLRSLLVLAGLAASASICWGSWVNRNPGAGGAFTSVAPGAVSGYVYATCDVGGAAMTRDGGAHWKAIGSADSLDDQNDYCIAADPQDTNFVYIGGEDSLYVSSDGGKTFDGKFFSFISAIGICRNNPNVIYAAAAQGFQAFKTNTTFIYKSIDHGSHWTLLDNQGIPYTRFLKIIPDPVNPSTVYALSYPDFGQVVDHQIYKSINGGRSWNTSGPSGVVDVSDFAIDNAHTNVLYCTVYTDNTSTGVYRSQDYGASWLRMTGTQQKYRGTITTATTSSTVIDTTLSDLSPNPFYDGSDNTYLEDQTGPLSGVFDVTTDGSQCNTDGLTFGAADTSRAISYVQPYLRLKAMNPLAGTDAAGVPSQALMVTVLDSDNTVTFPFDMSSNVWTNITLPPLYTDPSGNQWNWARLLTLRVSATFHYKNDQLPFGPSNLSLRMSEFYLVVNGGETTIYVNDPQSTGTGGSDGVGGLADSMFYSINQGQTWRNFPTTGWDHWWKNNVDNGYSKNAYGFAKTFASDPNNPSILWQIGSQFITKSTNAGQTFTNAFADVVGATYAGRGIDDTEPTACDANGGAIFEGLYDLGIWRSVDGGVHWSNVNGQTGWSTTNSNGGNCLNILADKVGTTSVWMTNGLTADQTTLWYSTNTGASWTRNSGIPNGGMMLGLCYDSLSASGARKVYTTRAGSLYRSTDNGHSFAPISGPSTLRCVAAKGDTVVAGGEGGLYRCNSITAPFPVWTYLGFSPTTFDGRSLPGAVDVQANWNGGHDIKIVGSKMIYATYACSPNGCVLKGGFWEAPLGVAPGESNFAMLLQTNYARQVVIAQNGDIYMSASDASKAGGKADNRAGGLVKSTDAMQTWTDITAGLPWPQMCWPVCVDPSASAWVLVGNPGAGFWMGP